MQKITLSNSEFDELIQQVQKKLSIENLPVPGNGILQHPFEKESVIELTDEQNIQWDTEFNNAQFVNERGSN